MKTARERAHGLAAGIVPSCYSLGHGYGIEHSGHCNHLTNELEAIVAEWKTLVSAMELDAVDAAFMAERKGWVAGVRAGVQLSAIDDSEGAVDRLIARGPK